MTVLRKVMLARDTGLAEELARRGVPADARVEVTIATLPAEYDDGEWTPEEMAALAYAALDDPEDDTDYSDVRIIEHNPLYRGP